MSNAALAAARTLVAACLAQLICACGDGGPTESSPEVATIAIRPSEIEFLEVADTARLGAEARDAAGALIPGVDIFWSSSDQTVAVVTQEGLATATGHGRATVWAAAAGVRGTASVDVVIGRRRVAIDEAHFNYHTVEGRYAPFADLLRSKGYVVSSSAVPFDRAALMVVDILVISNALAEQNAAGGWSLPTPSAFEPEEIDAVRDWVSDGGSLLLIADHMPFPGAAQALAAVFGIEFRNNFAFDTLQLSEPSTCLTAEEIHVFRRSDGTLANHFISDGENAGRRVDSVATFTGQAFQSDGNADSLMVFGPTSVALFPLTAWNFPASLSPIPVHRWLQGATARYGEGKVAAFGEAAMFTSQDCGSPMGFNSPVAGQNAQFLVNVLHWLSGLLEES